MADFMTRTLSFGDFDSPRELFEVIQHLLSQAQNRGVDSSNVNLDAECRSAVLVENTLTDGSKVYNIELS